MEVVSIKQREEGTTLRRFDLPNRFYFPLPSSLFSRHEAGFCLTPFF